MGKEGKGFYHITKVERYHNPENEEKFANSYEKMVAQYLTSLTGQTELSTLTKHCFLVPIIFTNAN